MWGFHDRLLTLRKALYTFLIESSLVDGLKRRWKYHLGKVNSEVGFFYSENEWEKEWSNIINLASPRPRYKHLFIYFFVYNITNILRANHIAFPQLDANKSKQIKNNNGQPVLIRQWQCAAYHHHLSILS